MRKVITSIRASSISSRKKSVEKALGYAYRDRKVRKREFRKLWIIRIGAAARQNGLNYNQLIHGLKVAGVDLDRKVLADIALQDPAAFTKLAETARKASQTLNSLMGFRVKRCLQSGSASFVLSNSSLTANASPWPICDPSKNIRTDTSPASPAFLPFNFRTSQRLPATERAEFGRVANEDQDQGRRRHGGAASKALRGRSNSAALERERLDVTLPGNRRRIGHVIR